MTTGPTTTGPMTATTTGPATATNTAQCSARRSCMPRTTAAAGGRGCPRAHADGGAAPPQADGGQRAPYLNKGGWITRSIVYWLIWIIIAIGYFRGSTLQDESKDFALTNRMESFAPLAAMAFGVTLTFAAFDWIMAMEPTWYSTIFGVHVFAGAACVVLSTMIVVLMSLADAGYLGKAVNVEHFHDLGKLLFGFMCFWAYVGFSQWMLIYYAGIPEEATYFERRWGGGWEILAYILIFGHFVAPFLFFMSRVVKRNLPLLKGTAVWLVVMHIVDMYWYVMPYADAGHPQLSIHPMDFGALCSSWAAPSSRPSSWS